MLKYLDSANEMRTHKTYLEQVEGLMKGLGMGRTGCSSLSLQTALVPPGTAPPVMTLTDTRTLWLPHH